MLLVVSTQVVEAGVDISAALLLTEVAPWPSIVQRAGRCNRDGLTDNATLLWVSPPESLPYEDADVSASTAALVELDGMEMTGAALGALDVATTRVQHDVLRRRDLIDLFDTTPDLSGNDIDVSRFIRDSDDLNVQIAWRAMDDAGPGAANAPTSAELCSVPVGEAKAFAKSKTLWRFDHLDAKRWVTCSERDVRPGTVLLAPDTAGGYTPTFGWSRLSKTRVVPIDGDEALVLVPSVEATADDGLSEGQRAWLGLRDHLADVEYETQRIAAALELAGLAPSQLEAAGVAARLHDVGKAHAVFQDTLARTCSDDEEPDIVGPWAKSAGSLQARHSRRYFRHELVSALMLLGEAAPTLDDIEEKDLVCYLVAAHHGRVRLGIRSLPDEARNEVNPEGRVPLATAESFGMWVLTGVLERHPHLKLVFVEPGIGWVTWWLYHVDDMVARSGYEFPG